MTWMEELTQDLEMAMRLIAVITEADLKTKEGKKMKRILLNRKAKYEDLIKAYAWDPNKCN